jgi:RHH-type proline utilization regulon transcriptional repressor/proline dehydrogenase/delta 1-pyrroline-5-carboxylate dehydrogenase
MSHSPSTPAGIDWDSIDAEKFAPESEAVRALNAQAGLDSAARARVATAAIDLVERARSARTRTGLMESFLQEFGLTNKEGLALMCLAEALLRVPDAKTADALIAEKIGSGAWGEHAWKSENWLVNASTLGLMLSGSLMDLDPEAHRDPGSYFRNIAGRVGEPVIRTATRQAMRILGEQFVLGRTINGAIKRGHAWKVREGHQPLFSFDMLGEGARTQGDAARYHTRYMEAITAVAKSRQDGPVETVDGVSVKLSALHPRYTIFKREALWRELYPKVLEQAQAARAADIGFCLDAEESDRLVLQLMILERLAHEPSLAGWNGLGLAVQAYQKRARAVIARLAELGRASGRRLMVRLVKGAYWDTEVKFSQMNGWPDFPVWTTKSATDLNYLACARVMLGEPDSIYPQFATHNAHSLCAVREIAAELGNDAYEFQRLHGMGEPLYTAAASAFALRPIRVYAPVGSHEDLLPYLVRRLLENGANTSFVHAFLDPDVPAADVARGPFDGADNMDRHPFIPSPPRLYGPHRDNSTGVDLSQKDVRARLADAQARFDKAMPHSCGPIVSAKVKAGAARDQASPSDNSVIVSQVSEADEAMVDAAFAAADKAFDGWDRLGGPARAAILRKLADALEVETDRFMAILSREAGKTLNDGVAEVREAVDFLRYYAAEAEAKFGHAVRLPGPAGETNHLELGGRGVFACISPWNFPLAIFVGQISAALAAGNTVVAKPAEQTPLVAFETIRLFQKAGLPKDVVQLVPGDGKVGALMTGHKLLGGVAFTGSTEVARIINQTLAQREGAILPLIAETGGLNAMFVDTSALREQVVDDAVQSAFGSAGQRCSALRILFLPRETASQTIEALKGAMDVLALGNPADPYTDIGPVIDTDALGLLEDHAARMEREATILHRAPLGDDLKAAGHFFAPLLVELTSLDGMDREVFGPILHVIRYKRSDLPKLAAQLAAKGYGLTLGVHSRLQRFLDSVRTAVPAGNTYVNRNMIGAVVGVQPFGGEGLSGTGPKAGGPHYLYRFAAERVVTINIAAQGGDPELLNLG